MNHKQKKKSEETVFLPVKVGLPPLTPLPVSTDLIIFRQKHILVKNGLHLSFQMSVQFVFGALLVFCPTEFGISDVETSVHTQWT